MTKNKDETTLRDIYAGMAMQALIEKTTSVHVDNDGARHLHMNDPSELARTSFELADAMLAERNKDRQ